MARYTGPVCRLCRRAGEKLYLKGDKCYTDKCPVDRRSYPPGEHGQGRRKVSDYALHLQEKQNLRRIYGVLERQFQRYYELAAKTKGVTGDTLIQILERRLDNVVFRLGFGASRAQARQLVMHGHVAVNGRKVDIPSYLVKPGDVIAIRERSRELDLIKANVEAAQQRGVPGWLSFSPETVSGEVLELPRREQIDLDVEEHLVVEYYSR